MNSLLRPVLLRASRSETLRDLAPRLPMVRRTVSRFMPGEELEDAIRAAEELNEIGLDAVFTELGEEVTDSEGAAAVARHYRQVLDRVDGREEDIEISVKLTHLGLELDYETARDHVVELAQRAARKDNFVWIDMEDSDYTDPTLRLFTEVNEEYQNTGLCMQAYLRRTADDLEALLDRRVSVRLVKGAYDEPRGLAYQDPEAVNTNFLALGRRLLDSASEDGVRHALGTHDDRLIDELLRDAAERGVPAELYEVQMLYGIRDDLQRQLAARGVAVRTLVSYGDAWYPWFVRRLAERPANLLLLVRNAM